MTRKDGAFAGFGATQTLIDPVLYRKAARTLVTLGTRKRCSPAEIAETLDMIGYVDQETPPESPSDRFSARESGSPVSPIQTTPEKPSAADSGPAIRMCKRGLHPLEGHNLIQRGDRAECRACRNARRRRQRAVNKPRDIHAITNDLIDTWHSWYDTTPTWITKLDLYAFLQFNKDASYAYVLDNVIPENRHDYLRWLHHALNLDRKPDDQ